MASAPNRPPSASAPVSPMKIRAGAAFHHRNPVDRAHHRRRDDRGVERRVRVDRRSRPPDGPQAAGVAELPERDEHVRRQHEDRRAGRQPVEPVGEVHGVRRRGEDDERPDVEEHAEVAARGADERQLRRRAGFRRVVHDDEREEHRHDRRAQELLGLRQPERASRRTFKKSSRNPTTPNPTAANSSASPAGVTRWNVNREAR